jgi:prepilin signal peptidase PulO-like enzyme (type II secretory pathway)
MLIVYICIFFFGASIASFINATLYRLDKGYKYLDIITRNSSCEECKKKLSWIQLIPIIGYLIYRGKCKDCKKPVRLYYPISEFLLGVSFLVMYLYGIPIHFYAIVILLFILSYHDTISLSVSQNVVHILLITSVLIFFFLALIPSNLIAPLVVCILLLIINIFKKSFGFGDILVLFSVGILQSTNQFLCTFWLGVIIALFYSIYLIIKKKRKLMNMKVPMIPFFSISFVISVIYGETILESILKIIGM